MGWCSGTEIFDDICEVVLECAMSNDEKSAIIKVTINSLENQDWDCQDESEYYNHPLVQKVFKELHPDWFEDDKVEDVYLLTIEHNDENTHIEGIFTSKEKAIEARKYLKEDFPETPYNISKYKLNPKLEDL